MKTKLLFTFFSICLSLNTYSQSAKAGEDLNANITYKIIDAESGTYGYDIYIDDVLTIHQPSIPAMSGNDGFRTKEAATKVAELVISKIRKGEMPPTITIDEMKKIKAV